MSSVSERVSYKEHQLQVLPAAVVLTCLVGSSILLLGMWCWIVKMRY